MGSVRVLVSAGAGGATLDKRTETCDVGCQARTLEKKEKKTNHKTHALNIL